MITYEQLYERHPELLELREFKSDEEIFEYFKNGGEMWEVWGTLTGENGVEKIDIINTGIYEDKCKELKNEPIYYRKSIFENHNFGFISALQNSLDKAIFSTKESAEKFLAAVETAKENDDEWQGLIEKERIAYHIMDKIIDEMLNEMRGDNYNDYNEDQLFDSRDYENEEDEDDYE